MNRNAAVFGSAVSAAATTTFVAYFSIEDHSAKDVYRTAPTTSAARAPDSGALPEISRRGPVVATVTRSAVAVTPRELVSALLVSTGPIVPDNFFMVGIDCGGIEMWVPAEFAANARLSGNRFVLDRPGIPSGIPYRLIPAHVRACDANGDGLLDGRDVQAFVETLE